MQFSTSTLGVLAAAAGLAGAQSGTTLQVAVGQNGLAFTPSAITADVGTAIEFSFFPKNHSVTQSSFADPCHPLAGGFFSSFVPTAASPSGSTFTIIVNDTKPVWIYCGQTAGNHCQTGMVAAINAPSTGNTLDAFKAKALDATTSTSPLGGAVGGVLALANKNTGSSSSSSTSGSGSGSGSGSSSTVVKSETTTVQTTVIETVTAVVTGDSSTYTTTYATSVPTTLATTAAVASVVAAGTSTGGAPGMKIGVGIAAVLVAALVAL